MNNELEIKISSSVEEANKKLDKLIDKLNNGANASDNLTKSASNIGKAFNFSSAYIMARKFFKLFFNGINDINNYAETLNMFHLVMGDLTSQADKFQNTMAEAFGNDTQQQLEYQSYFQTLTESMGLQEKYAYIISENMTKMTYDISSLFDKEQKDVASALRAGLVGQTKPVRNFGMDITENSLQPILDNLEIDRTVRELSQAEKEIVRYLALLRQSTIAHGDMANTIESPSNQLRVFKNQLIECSRWFGALFIDLFGRAMPYINGVAMALKEVMKAIGSMFGIEIKDYNSGVAGYYSDIGDEADDATGKVKELKRQVLGFDQINNINENKDNGSANVSGGIDQRLLDAITGYDNGMEKVRMKATEIRDKIMEWLGFTKVLNKETGEVSFKLKKGYSNLKLIGGIIGTLLGIGLVSKVASLSSILVKFGTNIWNVAKKVFYFGKALSSLFTGSSSISLAGTGFEKLSSILGTVNAKFQILAETLGMSTGSLLLVSGLVMALAGCLIYAYNESDVFRGKVNLLGENIVNIFTEVYNFISNIILQIWEVIEPIWNIIGDTIIFTVKYAYESVKLNFSNILDVINGAVGTISNLLKGDFKGAFDSACGTVENLKNNWKTYFEEIGKDFEEWKEKTEKNIKEFVKKAIEKFNGLEKWLKELPNKFFYWFGKGVGTAWKVITETNWLKLGSDILEGIWKGLCDFGTKITNWAMDLFNKIKESILNIDWGQIGKSIVDGIKKGWEEKVNTVAGWGNSFLKGLKDGLGIHSPSKKAIPIGVYTLMGIEEGMEDEIPNVQKTALKMLDTLETTFDKGMYNLSLESAMTPNFNQDVSNLSTYNSSANIDYNMLEQASYNGFARAIKQYGLVKIDVKQDKGSIVETAIEGINNIKKQTGESPIDVW